MREALMLRMINIYGFENEITINFCQLCESDFINDDALRVIVEAHEASPIF